MTTKDEYSRFPGIPKNIVDGTTSYYDLANDAYEAGRADARTVIAGAPQATTLKRVDVTAPNRPVSDYQYNQNLINSILKAPMTQEEEEKRQRSAYAISGIGALGNAFSAFSNLAFTGMGAPSQTLPTLPDTYGLVKDMQDRNQKDRENYLRYKTAARSADRSEWAQDQNVYLQQKGHNDNVDRYNSETTYNRYWKGQEYADNMGAKAEARAKNAYDAAVEAQKHADDLRIADRNYALQKQIHEDTLAENEKNRDQRLKELGIKTSMGLMSEVNMLRSDGKGGHILVPTTIDFSKVSEQTMAGLCNSLPEDLRKKYEREKKGAKGDPKKTFTIQTNAVITALSNTEDATYADKVIPVLEKLGAVGSSTQTGGYGAFGGTPRNATNSWE